MTAFDNTPEFGPNGAVLNAATMTDDLQDKYKKQALKDNLQFMPKVWPLSALVLILFGAMLIGGSIVASDDDVKFWSRMVGWSLLAIGYIRRHLWEKHNSSK